MSILKRNTCFREILIVGTSNCRLCENGGDIDLQLGREVKTESLRGNLWTKTAGDRNKVRLGASDEVRDQEH